MTKSELTKLTVAELKALAKKIKLALPSGLTKARIVTALVQAAGKAARAVAVKKTAGPKGNGKSAARRSTEAPSRTVPKRTKPAAEARPSKAASAGAARVAVRKVKEPEWRMPPGREEPTLAQERVADAKFYTGAGEPAAAGAYDSLPNEYGQERMALLARDPHTVFAFWEMPQSRLDQAHARLGMDARLCIRVYDVTGVSFNGGNEGGYFDQEVYERVGSWYFNLGRAGHTFCADLGVRTPDGRFQALVRSNTVAVPREGFSDVLDEEWMALEEEFLRLYGLSGKNLGGMSSAQVHELMQELMRKRRLLEISSPGQFRGRREQAPHK